jgi:CHAD domain-containing protein
LAVVDRAALRDSLRQRAAVRKALATPRFAVLVLDLLVWSEPRAGAQAGCAESPAAALTLARFARKAVRRVTRRLLADADGFAELSAERRHRVRIRAKRLRYTLELFTHALPRGRRRPLLEALKGLQNALGELNDVAEARAALARLRAAPALRAAAEARWAAAADEQQARAAGAFAALRRQAS